MSFLKQYPIPSTILIFVILSAAGYYFSAAAMGTVSEPGKLIGVWMIVGGIVARLVYNALVPAAPKAVAGD